MSKVYLDSSETGFRRWGGKSNKNFKEECTGICNKFDCKKQKKKKSSSIQSCDFHDQNSKWTQEDKNYLISLKKGENLLLLENPKAKPPKIDKLVIESTVKFCVIIFNDDDDVEKSRVLPSKDLLEEVVEHFLNSAC